MSAADTKADIVDAFLREHIIDKTGEAAIAFLEFMFLELLRRLDWFVPLWERATTLWLWADVGKQFRNEVFLHYALLDLVCKRKKKVILQFFVPGHGKTRLDGTVFGQAGVGGTVAEL